MKVKKLIIKNIGLVADTTIDLDKPLILFYGDLMQGKTTLLNSVKYVFGGGYPTDLIRHGEKEASVTLEFDNGSITREWYCQKDTGAVKDRPVMFIMDGKPVKNPVAEIKKFLNPYLLDSEHFMKMKEPERKVYLGQLFAVDNSDIDKQQATLEAEGKELRATIKAYGDIDTTEVKLLDTDAAENELAKIKSEHAERMSTHEATVRAIQAGYLNSVRATDAHNSEVSMHNSDVDRAMERVKRNEAEILRLQDLVRDDKEWVSANPHKKHVLPPTVPANPATPEAPDTSAIEATIRQGEANKVLYAAYQERLVRNAKKQADQARLTEIEAKWRELKKQKIARLKDIDTGGISGLAFDENGNFLYEGTQASMLSTSQVMRLSGELSSLYPQGLGLELIDRAESLGRSIFTFIDRAKREEKSILATIVGEKPAVVPDEVGVWIVESGELK